MVEAMRPGSVLVDIAIDQGGCFEDSHPTTHSDPVYRVADSLFYCVANMPGAVGATATAALTTATLPYIRELATGVWPAMAANPALARIYGFESPLEFLKFLRARLHMQLEHILRAFDFLGL